MSNTTPNPLTFKLLRLLADGEFHSGESLARKTGVSRTTVWKALQAAEPWGVTLFKVHGRGYRLVTQIDWLDPQAVWRHLGGRAERFSVRVAEMLDSSNTVLMREALAGAPSGAVLAVELQTAGRGRRGRSWFSGLGGALTFSLLWRFRQGVSELAGLSLAVSLALLRAVQELGASDIMLKWPNDLLWQHHKLAGVLVELEGDMMGPSAAVIGIGLNVRLAHNVRERIDQAVTDLESIGVRVERNRLLACVLGHLADVLDVFREKGLAPLRGEWERSHVLAGRHVVVTLPDRTRHAGQVVGIDDEGALMLTGASGVKRYHSGEVSLRPADSAPTWPLEKAG